MAVAACLDVDSRGRLMPQVLGHHGGGAAQKSKRADQHPLVANRHKLRNAGAVAPRQNSDRVALAGSVQIGVLLARRLAPQTSAVLVTLCERARGGHCARSELRGVEGVAGVELSRSQPGHEPAGALRRGAMGEGVGYDIALALPLQPVITDGRGGLQSGLDVAGLDEVPSLLRVMRPYAGEAIGLQLDADLDAVGVGPVHALLHPLDLWKNPEQVLHMMPHLVGDHVGLRELAGFAARITGAKASLEVLEERRVQVNLAIVRAVERPHRGLRGAAGRACRAREHDERRRLVLLAGLCEDLLPLSLGASEHGRDELPGLIGRRSGSCRLATLLLGAVSAGENLGAVDQQPRVDAEPPGEKSQHDDGAYAETSATARHPEAAALATAILDVVAARQLIQTHVRLSFSWPTCQFSARIVDAAPGAIAAPL